MVDALRLEGLPGHVGRSGERLVDVAADVRGPAELIAREGPDGIFVGGKRRRRIGEWLMHVVGHGDRRRGGPSLGTGFGHDKRHHIAEIGGTAADRDEGRPVLVNQPAAQLAGDIIGGEHRNHAGHGKRIGWLDGHDVGASVFAEDDRPVQTALGLHVVDEAAVAERELLTLVLHTASADPTLRDGDRGLAGGKRLDGVEDLHVAGATAQMSPKMAGGVVTGGFLVAVEQGNGAHHDARCAEAALQCTVGGERVSHSLPLGFVDTLERGDLGAGCLLERGLARDARFAVDQHRAAPALARR